MASATARSESDFFRSEIETDVTASQRLYRNDDQENNGVTRGETYGNQHLQFVQTNDHGCDLSVSTELLRGRDIFIARLGRCAFGIDTDMQNDTNNIYLRKAAGTFELDVDKLPIVKLTSLLPCFERPFRYFYLGLVAVRRAVVSIVPSLDQYIGETPGSWLINRVKDVVDLRNNNLSDEVKRTDLLQLMIDASTRNDIQVGTK